MEELLKNKLGLQVLTDTGWSNFEGLLDKGLQKTLKVKTETKEITCTPDHNFFDNKFCPIEAQKLFPGIRIQVASGIEKSSICKTIQRRTSI